MVKRTAVLLFMLGFAPALPVRAGSGSDAVPFMKTGAGARAAGMGGAFAAAADDVSAVFHNPAGMALAERKEFMFGHAEWLEGIRSESLSYIHPANADWTFGGGASMLFSGSMTRYDRAGAATGEFTENEGFFSLGAARVLSAAWSGGAALKTVYQKADTESAYAYALDAGLLYRHEAWRFALAFENVGSRLKLYREGFELPAGYKAGAAWRALDAAWITAQLTYRPAGGAAAAAGAEYGLPVKGNDLFFIRAGYTAGGPERAGSGLALGIGVGSSDLKLDYAFTPFGDLGNGHKISLNAKFGSVRPAPGPEAWRPRKEEKEPRKQQPQKRIGNVRKDGYFTW